MISEVKRYQPSPPTTPRLCSQSTTQSTSSFSQQELPLLSDSDDLYYDDDEDSDLRGGLCSSSGSSMSLDDTSMIMVSTDVALSPTFPSITASNVANIVTNLERSDFTNKKHTKQLRQTLSRTLELEANEIAEFAKFHSNQTSQHFLRKQVCL